MVKQTIFFKVINHHNKSRLNKILPPTNAKIENDTFANIFMNTFKISRFSNIIVLSNAKDDIVVNEPQNPIAISSEYFVSKL